MIRTAHRLTEQSKEGRHVWALGARIGYWPCLRAPFLQVTLGPHIVELWVHFGESK